MGSFNTTCFASMQTIASYDECYIIPILRENSYQPCEISIGDEKHSKFSSYSSTCYYNAFWSPLSRPIHAVYDDYGRVVVKNTKDNINIISAFFKDNLKRFYKTEEGENSCHDIAFDPATIDVTKPIESLNEMWDAVVHENRVFLKSWNQVPSQLGFAVISKRAVDTLVNTHLKTKNYNGTANTYAAVTSRMEKEYYKHTSHLPDDRKIWSFSFVFDNVFRCGDGYRAFAEDIKYEIMDELKGTTKFSPEVKKKLKVLLRELFLFCQLNHLNIKLTPIFYASQDYTNDIGKDYAKFVQKTCELISSDRKKQYEDF